MFFHNSLFLILFIVNQIDTNQYIPSSSNKICTVQYDKRLLKEGDEIIILRKLYKVEDCQLQRAYQACGTHLWFVISIVCEAIELQKEKNIRRNRFRRFTEEKLLSDACCLSTCTVNEMARYCPY